VVGLTYHIILRSLWDPQGLQYIVDELLHTVLPVLFVIYWALFVPKSSLQWKGILSWLILPVAYCVYSFIRGGCTGWYPYPFLDINLLGRQQVIYNVGGMILLFLVITFLLVGVAKMGRKHEGK